MHGGLSPELTNLDQIHRVMRPVEVPDTGILCDLLWSDPEAEVQGWVGKNLKIKNRNNIFWLFFSFHISLIPF